MENRSILHGHVCVMNLIEMLLTLFFQVIRLSGTSGGITKEYQVIKSLGRGIISTPFKMFASLLRFTNDDSLLSEIARYDPLSFF